MKLTKHDRFLRELRTSVKQYQKNQLLRKRQNGSGSQQEPIKPGTPIELAGVSDADEQLSIEKLLEEKFDELFGKFDDNE